MGRRARIEITRTVRERSWDGAAGLLWAALIAVILALAISASTALAVTGPPELIAPTASSAHGSPLSIEYKLPEAGSAAAISFVPSVGAPVIVTLTPAAQAAGKHHFFLELSSLESETANVAKASAASLSDGEYTIQISYQNAAEDPAASAFAEKVTIKTHTGTPTMTQPTAGQSFRKPFTVKYTLPEAALAGSVRLLLIGTHVGTRTLVLANTAAGAHTAEVLPSNPAGGEGVASGPSERLPSDSYQLALTYQDALANPLASVSVPIEIGYLLCKAGSYSASGGEEPCAKAPKGYFVPGEGATTSQECPLGHFAAVEGLSECLPATPGHYVPATGAKAELECEQGTYNGEAGRSSCLPAPIGHYAAKGAIAPTACPAGTSDAHTNSPSAEFCEYENTTTTTGTNPVTSLPSSVAATLVSGATTKFAIAAAKHATSLAKTSRQRYLVTCSAATTVQVRVAATVRAGKKHLVLTARTLTLKCAAAKASEASASFKLSGTVKKLLAKHSASVKLSVRVYPPAGAAAKQLAGATLPGRP